MGAGAGMLSLGEANRKVEGWRLTFTSTLGLDHPSRGLRLHLGTQETSVTTKTGRLGTRWEGTPGEKLPGLPCFCLTYQLPVAKETQPTGLA